MTTRTADVVARADFRDLFAEFKRTGRVVHELEGDLEGLGDAGERFAELGEAVAELGARVSGVAELPRAMKAAAAAAAEATAQTQKQAKATADLVAVRGRDRREQLEALQHQRQMAEALGRDQAEIDELVAREAGMRREMAVLEGNFAGARKVARAEELRLARRTRAEAKAASRAEIAAAERRRAIEDEAATSKQRALQAQENALRRQAELREMSGLEALRNEQKILALQVQQAQVGIARTADARFRKMQRILDLQVRQVVVSRKLAHVNRSIFSSEKFQKIKAGFSDMASKAMSAAAAVGMLVGAVAGIDRLMQASIKLDAVYKNLPFGIDQAKTSTKGLVDEMELAQAAIEAQRLGVVDSEEDFAKLAGAAVKLGLSVGRDATESVRDLTAALGKGETELLDNLGIKLRVSEAEKAYAARLGVSKEMLTDTQKAEAFRTMGMIKAVEAAETVNIEIDSGAAKWAAWKQEVAELGREVLPRVIDTLEVLIDVIEYQIDVWDKVLMTIDDVVDQMFVWVDALTLGEDATRTMVRGVNALNEELTANLYHVHNTIKAFEELDAKVDAEKKAKAAEDQRQKEIAARDAQIATTKQVIWEMEKQRKIMEAKGGEQKRLNDMIDLQTELEADVLLLQGKELEAEKLLVDHEARKIKARRKQAEEWGRSYDRRIAREREAAMAEVAARRALAEAEGALRTRAADRHRVELELVRLAREELDVRSEAAEKLRTSSADKRHEKQQELLEITTQRRLLDVKAMELELERAEELAQWQLESIDREIEMREAQGLAVDELREKRRLAAAELAAQFGDENELAQALHEAELERRSEKQERIAEEHASWLEQRDQEIEMLALTGQNVDLYYARRYELEARLANLEGDHERARAAQHKAEIARLRREAHVRKQVHGTVDALMTGSAQVAEFAAEHAIRSDKKREAVFKRIQGAMAIARGAVELVEGVAAAARYDYAAAAQHFIASALGFAKGGVLLAGGLPGKGKDAGGGAANSGAYYSPSANDGAYGGKGETFGDRERSVPLSGTGVTGEDLDRASRGSVGSGASAQGSTTTVNINAPIITNDSGLILDEISRSGSKGYGDVGT